MENTNTPSNCPVKKITPGAFFIPERSLNGNINFYRIINALVETRKIAAIKGAVLKEIARHTFENGRCWVSAAAISDATGYQIINVRKTMQELKEEKLLRGIPDARMWGARSKFSVRLYLLWSDKYEPVAEQLRPRFSEKKPKSSYNQEKERDIKDTRTTQAKPVVVSDYNHDEIKTDDTHLKSMLEPLCHNIKSLNPPDFNPFQFAQYLMKRNHDGTFIADTLTRIYNTIQSGRQKIGNWFRYALGVVRKTLKQEQSKPEHFDAPVEHTPSEPQNDIGGSVDIDPELKMQVEAICHEINVVHPQPLFNLKFEFENAIKKQWDASRIISKFEFMLDFAKRAQLKKVDILS